jgi:hypothetical protein
MRRTYITFLGSGALTLIGFGATILLQGGWQAAVAAFAIFQGIVFASSFGILRAAAEHPRPRRPDWAVADGRPQAVPATSGRERATADVRAARAVRAPRSVHA